MNVFTSISRELDLMRQNKESIDVETSIIDNTNFIDRLDNQGTIWPKGLFKHLSNNYAQDGRYQFMSRFSRSAFFGELLVKEYALAQFGTCTNEMIECGRLLNLFITAFDSVCDEITEELPLTLRSLNKMFSVFPNQVETKQPIEYNLTGFTLSLAYKVAKILGNAICQFNPSEQTLFVEAIVTAFQSQVKELSVSTAEPDDQATIVDLKSIGPFAVSMIIPHVLLGQAKKTECIRPVSVAMGRLFGWVDDLADWKEDALSRKTTSLNLFLNQKVITESDLNVHSNQLTRETIKRYEQLSTELYNHELVEMDSPLKSAMARWLSRTM